MYLAQWTQQNPHRKQLFRQQTSWINGALQLLWNETAFYFDFGSSVWVIVRKHFSFSSLSLIYLLLTHISLFAALVQVLLAGLFISAKKCLWRGVGKKKAGHCSVCFKPSGNVGASETYFRSCTFSGEFVKFFCSRGWMWVVGANWEEEQQWNSPQHWIPVLCIHPRLGKGTCLKLLLHEGEAGQIPWLKIGMPEGFGCFMLKLRG